MRSHSRSDSRAESREGHSPGRTRPAAPDPPPAHPGGDRMSTALGIGLGIVLILALTAATGYFVAQEFAYVAVDRNALRQLADDGDAAAQRALSVTSQLSFTLSAAQFGITVTALLVGYVSEPLVGAGIAELLDPSMSYAARLSLSVTAVARLLDRRADGLRRAGPEEPRHRAHRAAGPVPEPLDPGLPHASPGRSSASSTVRRRPCCARSASSRSRSSSRAPRPRTSPASSTSRTRAACSTTTCPTSSRVGCASASSTPETS